MLPQPPHGEPSAVRSVYDGAGGEAIRVIGHDEDLNLAFEADGAAEASDD